MTTASDPNAESVPHPQEEDLRTSPLLLVRRALASPVTIATYILLVVPFALGWLKTELFSPLALPGYVLYNVGSAIGNALAPRFEFWVYWIPFLGSCYGLAVSVGVGYEWLRVRLTGSEPGGAKSADEQRRRL
ncbi:hypothetical protein [Natrialba asiatica]|uniref:Uncharacterized protein n=1 Tax=Natrialba asiatica (strain ATCC 700177 / DSM 12278 / JCM 9576 / FERM P-10747 / NBRC 102637 / 172P1) TaxID=29540 RepID=M0AWC9_NATA1|nr:hypothetical protein [Natrialba asiatica]ELZ02622.1 hypothetical protein C481_08141 [Natrialba asiatica DSM 12278]